MSIGSALLGSGGVGGLRGGVVRGGDALVDRRVGRLAARRARRGGWLRRHLGATGDRRRAAVDGSRTAAGRAVAATGTAVTLVTRTQRGSRRLLLAGQHLVALVDPDLHADAAERRTRLVETEVDVGAQRVQRDAAFAVELRAGHLGPTQATRALHPDALGDGLERRLHSLAHRTTEGHAAGQLLGHALRDELRVDLRRLHLEDVEVDVLAGELLEVATDAVGLSTAATDHDARTRGVDVDVDPVTRALDLNAADAGALHALRQHATDRDVFLHVVAVELVGVPPALVPGGDAEAEPVGVDLLSHQRVPSLRCAVFSCVGATTIVMWLVRLRIR